MPKMKTHRGAAKRFKVTGTGKLKRFKAFKSHILTKKSHLTINLLTFFISKIIIYHNVRTIEKYLYIFKCFIL